MLRSPAVAQLCQRRFYAQDFNIKRVIRIPKSKMYDVVGDVGKYQEFVPYCLESNVTKQGTNGSPTFAILRVGWKQLDEKFESKVTYGPDTVRATAADNQMFKELSSEWTIQELGSNQCSVALKLRFQFQNQLYDLMAQGAGALISRKMIEAFTRRAVEEYKKDRE